MVQEHVLAAIPSDSLAIYVVWEPMLQTDTKRSSWKATALFPDKRVRNYWVGTTGVGEIFQKPIDLTTEPAWDVYLVYRPGVRWTEDSPPHPQFFMHQLRGRLPDSLRFDGPRLASSIRDVLSR